MSTTQGSVYNCSTCQAAFKAEEEYKEHYKSEHHRYNLKRKMINLPPLSYEQYLEQFENPRTNSSTTADFKCEICNKNFCSPNTYSHHLNSKKHKNNRDRILKKPGQKTLNGSKSQSSSDFSIISHDEKVNEHCLFCSSGISEEHLKLHNFPPFKYNCSNYSGLVEYVRGLINSYTCLFCKTTFSSVEAVKQHMMEVGHGKIDTDNFTEFEEFYDWAIKEQENQSEDEWEVVEEVKTNSKLTLKELERQRRARIVVTNVGAKVNGRLIGLRAYKRYYDQYFRHVVHIDRTTKALTNYQDTPLKLKPACVPCIRA